MTFDGQQQRKALTALERTIDALGKGDAVSAARASRRAADLDQLGVYAALPETVTDITDLREEGLPVPDELWDELLDAVGPGPVAAVVEQLRSA